MSFTLPIYRKGFNMLEKKVTDIKEVKEILEEVRKAREIGKNPSICTLVDIYLQNDIYDFKKLAIEYISSCKYED